MGDDSGRLLADRDTKGKGKPFKTGNGSTPRRVSDQVGIVTALVICERDIIFL